MRASRAVADTVERGRRHGAPQPRRPRVLQDAHARRGRDVRRRGLRPLLLPRLLLRRQRHDPGAADPRAAERRGRKLSELLDRYRSTYFISGEINSEVEDGPAKLAEIEERYGDARIGHLDGVSVDYDDWHFNVRTSNTEPLMRLCLESLVSCEDMERRRDEVLEIIRVMTSHGGAARARAGRRRGHPLPADPDAVSGRARQHVPHRGRPADAGRQRAELGHRARRARARAGRPRPPRRGPRADRHLPPAHGPPRARRRSSRAARAREVAALDLLAPWVAHWSDGMEADDAFAERIMAEHGIPEDVRLALLAVSQSYRGWGAAATVTRPLAAGSRAAAARPHAARPAPPRPLAVGHDLPRRRARHRARRRPPHQAHLLQPAHLAAARRASWTPTGGRTRAPARAGDLHRRRCARRGRWSDVDMVLAGHGEPVTDHVALIDERFRMHKRRADEDPPADRRSGRARRTRSRSRCGATSR